MFEATSSTLGDRGQVHPTAAASEVDRELRRLSSDFEGALPYLQLIATANGIGDPLDPRVVDAYWIGNRLVDNVDAAVMARSLDERFRSRVSATEWPWLAAKPAAGATPTHAFHVLDVYPRAGLMRGGELGDAIGLMDACRIRWGQVTEVARDRVLVSVAPLQLWAGRLVLGAARVESVRRWPGDDDLLGLQPRSLVSLHWGWICETLSPERATRLISRTRAQLAVSNQTI